MGKKHFKTYNANLRQWVKGGVEVHLTNLEHLNLQTLEVDSD
jgi:hypothetical protein